MRWIDNHCHMTLEESKELLPAARAANVERCIVIGTDRSTSAEAQRVAQAHEGVWATAGIHPHEAEHGTAGIAELLDQPFVAAVGECGLDYFYDHSPRPEQRAVFAEHIGWAHELDQALVVHSRDAWDDTFAILDSEGIPPRTVLHCFTGGVAEAEKALERGASLSFSGIITFPNAENVREAAAICPLERLLVETDAPFLTPVPYRGKPNAPANVVIVGQRLAETKGLSAAEIAEATWRNASKLYKLDD